MPAQGSDVYSNVIKKAVTMSAANTLTFEEIEIGLNLFDKVGLVIHRVAYEVGRASYLLLEGEGDDIAMAITLSNSVSSISPTERSTVDYERYQSIAYGTPANAETKKMPEIHDLSGLPGGGLLIPPKPLYLAMTSTSLASACTGTVNIYFTIKQLKDADYFELLETFRFFE